MTSPLVSALFFEFGLEATKNSLVLPRLRSENSDKNYIRRVWHKNSWNVCDGGPTKMSKIGLTNLEIMTG